LREEEVAYGSEDDLEAMSNDLENLEYLNNWEENQLWEEEMAHGLKDDL
jgi:hypothetical protein